MSEHGWGHGGRLQEDRSAAAPSPAGAVVGRRIGIGVTHTLWRPRVLGAWRVPASGPLIMAANHSNGADGPLVFGASPRPMHFLIKHEVFVGPVGLFLRRIGQVPLDRSGTDRTALTSALAVLEAGGVLGIFPEGTRGDGDFASLRAGLAYFALRSGAPVLPVACLGTAGQGGRGALSFPRRRVDVVFGDPFDAGDGSRLRTRAALDAATLRIQERLRAHLAQARRLTGRQ